MDTDPQVSPYLTADETSFAFASARDRWPVILTGVIDDVHRAVGDCTEDEKRAEGKKIIEGLAKLKYELQHNRQMKPLDDDGQSDILAYNQELGSLNSPSWFSVSWLYAECYLYRRINVLFTLSSFWKRHDTFARQKLSTFRSSRPAVLELAARYRDILHGLEDKIVVERSLEEQEQAEKLLFIEMVEVCLWGNATDLSLLTSLTYEDIQKLQGSKARKASEANIIVNDLPAAYASLKSIREEKPMQDRRVDIILDNAGFELFVDLILASFLLSTKLATHIVLHPKSIPWFVSDVVPTDFVSLLSALASPQQFYTSASDDEKHAGKTPQPLTENEIDDLTFLFRHLSGFHQEGHLVLRPNRFWTQAGSFWRLPKGEPDLLKDLKESELIIFKGDLNYRKLTGDVMWEPTTPFSTAIGPLGLGSGLRLLTLRTCKSDVVVGLPEGEDERLRAMKDGGGKDGTRKWAWGGKWAVVQLCDGKK